MNENVGTTFIVILRKLELSITKRPPRHLSSSHCAFSDNDPTMQKAYEIRTVSIACTTPFLEVMSVASVFASPTTREPFPTLNCTSSPLAVMAFGLLTS